MENNKMNNKKSVKMGAMPEQWMGNRAKSITFCVTEDCNLACKYCYMTGKNSNIKMNFKTAKKAVDYVLSSTDEAFDYEGVVWEFIGGEPFLEMELIDKITDYIKIRMFILNHRWFECYKLNFSTNGILYHTQEVQNYIIKNREHISIGFSVDGNKIKHDLQRVWKNGAGTYDDVIKNVPLWLEQFPWGTTKATFSHDDLPYLKDSIISLWNLGLKIVPANVVYEDVWQEGDDLILENQLKDLADYIIKKEIWWDYSVRFFDPVSGFPATKEDLEKNYCGSGKMLAIDCEGNFFPCIRFYNISLNNRKGLVIGDVLNGINNDKIRPFQLLSYETQSTDECMNCSVATGCSWCTGCNYDFADTDTIYQRMTFLCKMHKANMRANDYFWNKLSKVLGYMPEERQTNIEKYLTNKNNKYLQLITSDYITPHCSYRNWRNTNEVMSSETIKQSLNFAQKNGYIPVLLGENQNTKNIKIEPEVFVIKNGDLIQVNAENEIPVFDNKIDYTSDTISNNSILLLNKENISNLSQLSKKLLEKTSRINLRLENIETWTKADLKLYEDQLDILSNRVLESYKNINPIEINVLTDIMTLDSLEDCGAGTTSFSVAPNGKIYFCPAFYFDNPQNFIGSLDEGLNIKNTYLLNANNAPICSGCDAFHCNRCKFLNKKTTNEINTPSQMQCIISHTERNKARILQIQLAEVGLECKNTITEIDYLDPLEKKIRTKKNVGGCL